MVMFTNDIYEKEMYEKILAHSNCLIELDEKYPEGEDFISAISIANYHDEENVAIECNKCNEVIIDFDRPEEETNG